jgi:hypothetical protein
MFSGESIGDPRSSKSILEKQLESVEKNKVKKLTTGD